MPGGGTGLAHHEASRADVRLERHAEVPAARESPGREPETAWKGKLDRARSRLYRGQILQENMHWKALAEIYAMHTFAQL